ncbi:hypothetical protein [Paenibacillus pseudetheri]|uniref:Uncharacterized protein n=1 Tax=Paenibacillus pseudetheri TaxID=2897682 RepID=A0ABN8FHN9_9BACL|nr:hypothetical protein [Paenibacillus pseudetheri]CAH1055957.1 hypothetical protein PAECIP111894_02110 [Paenibacillus pseudetheri]
MLQQVLKRFKRLAKEKPLFFPLLILASLFFSFYFIFNVRANIWISLILYFLSLSILYFDDLATEKIRGIIVVLTVPSVIIFTFIAGSVAFIIQGDFEPLQLFFNKFLLVFCFEEVVFFLVIHLNVINHSIKKKWKVAQLKNKVSREDDKKKIEEHLNKIKTASAYVAPIFTIPSIIYKALEIILPSLFTKDQSATNIHPADPLLLVLYIFTFSLLVMTVYRAVIDHLLFNLKYSDKYKI